MKLNDSEFKGRNLKVTHKRVNQPAFIRGGPAARGGRGRGGRGFRGGYRGGRGRGYRGGGRGGGYHPYYWWGMCAAERAHDLDAGPMLSFGGVRAEFGGWRRGMLNCSAKWMASPPIQSLVENMVRAGFVFVLLFFTHMIAFCIHASSTHSISLFRTTHTVHNI